MDGVYQLRFTLYILLYFGLIPFVYYYSIMDHHGRFLSSTVIVCILSYLMFSKFIYLSEMILCVIDKYKYPSSMSKEFTWLHILLHTLFIPFLYFASSPQPIIALILIALVLLVDAFATYWHIKEQPNLLEIADSICYNLLFMQTIVEFFDGKDVGLVFVFILVHLLLILISLFIAGRSSHLLAVGIVFGLVLLLTSNVNVYYDIVMTIWCLVVLGLYVFKIIQ